MDSRLSLSAFLVIRVFPLWLEMFVLALNDYFWNGKHSLSSGNSLINVSQGPQRRRIVTESNIESIIDRERTFLSLYNKREKEDARPCPLSFLPFRFITQCTIPSVVPQLLCRLASLINCHWLSMGIIRLVGGWAILE